MKWFKRIYLLYIFGFVLNFRPIDPFLYKFFLIHNNLTNYEVGYKILPIATYSSTVHFGLMFLLSGLCCFKVLLIISSVSAVVSTCIRVCSYSYTEVVISEVIRGTSLATEIAYYIYVYGYYDVTNYQQETAFVRVSALLGKAISAILAQHSLSQKWLRYEELEYVHLASIFLATICSFLLPAAKENVYELSPSLTAHKKCPDKLKERILKFMANFVLSFNQNHIARWSFWFVWSVWSYNQISTFIQPTWEKLHRSSYNGHVEACVAILSFFAVLIVAFRDINWKKGTVIIMPILSGFQYIILLSGMAFSDGFILFNYISYIMFSVIHYFIITAMCAEIAKIQLKYCFGLVFGFLYMIAGILNTIMVCSVNDSITAYRFTPEQQFLVYFIVFVVIFVVFFAASEIKKRIVAVVVRH